MINIVEQPSKKCAGNTSLWITFNYNEKIVETIKFVDGAVYYEKTKTWEVPAGTLSYLIDNLTYIDDITITLLPDTSQYKVSQVLNHKIKPYNYQSEGIDWIINHKSGLLTDVPGLGKSLQAIYAAEELKYQFGIEHCLIVCGINTLKQNWKKEINKFSTESCRVIGETIKPNGKVKYKSIKDRAIELVNEIPEFFVIINIESFRDPIIVDSILNSKNKFDMLVVDEIHTIKSNQTSQSTGLIKASKNFTYRYGLTGTLLINSPLDSYMPLKLIGHERASFTNFKNFYCEISKKFGHLQIDGFKNLDILKDEIGSCSLRRTKEIIANRYSIELPEKVIVPEFIEMDPDQSKFYEDLHNGIVAEADRVNIKNTSLLGLIVRLRQASTCPEILTSNSKIKSCKIQRAAELANEIVSGGDKVVIFSTFKEPLYRLRELLHVNAVVCTGDQSDKEISDSIDKFQSSDEIKILLCTTSKMSTGITLTAASYEIFIDTPWTNAEFEQACDRIHRIGTEKSVTIYNLIAKDTIDERVYELINSKEKMSDYILDGKGNTTTTEELKFLIGL